MFPRAHQPTSLQGREELPLGRGLYKGTEQEWVPTNDQNRMLSWWALRTARSTRHMHPEAPGIRTWSAHRVVHWTAELEAVLSWAQTP